MNIGVVLDNEIKKDIRVMNEVKSFVLGGNKVVVLCPAFSGQPLRGSFQGFEISRFKLSVKTKNILFGINNTIPLYDLLWIRQIKKFINTFNIDVLHVHDLYMAHAAHQAIKSTAIKLTLDLHENYPEAVKTYTWANTFPKSLLAKPEKWQKLERKYLNYADNIVVLSRNFMDSLIKKYPELNEKKFIVYPNVPDIRQLKSYPIENNILDKGNSFIIFYFGVIGVRRGIFTCFEAIKLLADKIPEIKFLLIGPVDKADKHEFDKWISDPLIKEHIIYYPWKDISLLSSYILKSDVCLSPLCKNAQHESGLANKIFQYMLFESPLIVSDCKPQVDIVEEAGCGLVYDNKSASDLAEKILFMYNNPAIRVQMGENGRNLIESKYNLAVMGENLTALYK